MRLVLGASLCTASLNAQYEQFIQDPSLDPSLTPATEAEPPPPPVLLTPSLHRHAIRALDQSADGRYLLSTDERTLKIWDVAHRAPIATYEQPTAGTHPRYAQDIVAAWFTDKPRQVLVCTTQNVFVFDDLDFSKPSAQFRRFRPFGYRFVAATQTLYWTSYDSDRRSLTLGRLDIATGQETHTQVITFDQPFASSEGKSLSVDAAGKIGTVTFPQSQDPAIVFELATGKVIQNLPGSTAVQGLLPDGRLLTRAVEGEQNRFGTLDLATLTPAPLFAVPYRYGVQTLLPTHPDDPLVLTAGDTFWTYDLKGGQLTQAVHLPDRWTNAALQYRQPNGGARPLLAQSSVIPGTRDVSATYLELFDPQAEVFRGQWTEPTYTPEAFYTRPDEFELVVRRGNAFRRVSFTEAGITSEPLAEPDTRIGPAQAYYDPAAREWKLVGAWRATLATPTTEAGKLEVDTLAQAMAPKTRFFSLSRDGRRIALHHETEVTVFDLENGQRLARAPLAVTTNFSLKREQIVALSPDGEIFAYAYQTIREGRAVDVLECRTVATGELRWSKTETSEWAYFDHLRFSPDGSQLYVNGNNAVGAANCLFTSTGEPARRMDVGQFLAYNAAGTLAVGRGGHYGNASAFQLKVTSLADGKQVSTVTLPATPRKISFIGSDRFLIADSATEELLRLIDLKEQAVIAEIQLFESPQKWLVRHPATGLFSSENSLHDQLMFRQGEQITPLAAYFEEFYRPRLLGSLVKGLTPRPTIPVSDLRYAPKLTLSVAGPATRGLSVEDEYETFELPTPEVTLQLEATCEGSPIADLRLYHNGKLVTGGTRGLFVEDDEDAPISETFTKSATHTFALTPGKNRFRAVAINEQGTESMPDELIVYSEAAAPESQGGLSLHLMVVGINAYRNPAYNLNYARADAEAVAAALRRSEAVFSQTNVYTLYDAEATRENILTTLETIRSEANPGDVFIFYYAGHGVMSDETEPKFYLAPYEITQLYGEDRLLRQLGVSSDSLLEFSRDIAAQKQLFILDACQSAGALKTVAQRGAVEEKAIAQLARSTGTHWLTATGSEQFAAEFDELGHGAFTYTLLQALDGAADSGDRLVSVNELKAYLEAQVPEVTAEKKGEPQYPVTYGYGQDFPLAVVR